MSLLIDHPKLGSAFYLQLGQSVQVLLSAVCIFFAFDVFVTMTMTVTEYTDGTVTEYTDDTMQ